jgi:hypothetical protein
LIDLHTHTTASDGRLSAGDLVALAAQAGVTVLSVTDHDTLAASDAVRTCCGAAGIEFVPGIEITAVVDGADVHLLGYFIETKSAWLEEFLVAQRAARANRVRQMVARLADFGIALDAAEILQPADADPSKSPGRPWIARALVARGHADSVGAAFETWLGRGKPAFVPRVGARPAEVMRRVHDAGGLVSLAHPGLAGLVGQPAGIARLAADGLDALEAYHSEQGPAATRQYLSIASALGLEVTGGSDFHGDPTHGPASPGAVSLPPEAYDRFRSRLESR